MRVYHSEGGNVSEKLGQATRAGSPGEEGMLPVNPEDSGSSTACAGASTSFLSSAGEAPSISSRCFEPPNISRNLWTSGGVLLSVPSRGTSALMAPPPSWERTACWPSLEIKWISTLPLVKPKRSTLDCLKTSYERVVDVEEDI